MYGDHTHARVCVWVGGWVVGVTVVVCDEPADGSLFAATSISNWTTGSEHSFCHRLCAWGLSAVVACSFSFGILDLLNKYCRAEYDCVHGLCGDVDLRL